MSSVVERTHVQISVVELVALLDSIGDAAKVARAVFPLERLEPDDLLAQAAGILLTVRDANGPAGLANVIDNLVAVAASAASTIELSVRGTVDRTVIYFVGPVWSADLVISEDGECALGLLLTSQLPQALRHDHLAFDASLDLTLLVRGQAGPVDLVFTAGVLANARGETVSIRGSGVSPAEFGDAFESAIAGYLS